MASKVGIAKNMRGMFRKWTPWDKYFIYQNFPTRFRLSLFQEWFGEIWRKPIRYWDIYFLLILKCMYKFELKMDAQIQPTDDVLHGSASNYILSDLHWTGIIAKKLLTSTSSQNVGSDCQSQNKRLTKIWSMSSMTELNVKRSDRMICLSVVYWSSWGK